MTIHDKDTRSHRVRRKYEGLAIGLAIGFCGWLPFLLLPRELLSSSLEMATGGSIILLLLVIVLALSTYIWRRRLLKLIFGDATSSSSSAAHAAANLLTDWKNKDSAELHLRQLITEVGALASWASIRRTLLTAVFGAGAALFAVVGSTFVLRQTEAIELQNNKLDAQTTLLKRQTDLLAGEGKWELFWNAHQAKDTRESVSLLHDLSDEGVPLSGFNLEGDVANRFDRYRFTVKSLSDGVTYDLSFQGPMGSSPFRSEIGQLPKFVPPEIWRNADNSSFTQLELATRFGAKPRNQINCQFDTCSLTLKERITVPGEGTFIGCMFDNSSILDTVGYRFDRCQIRSCSVLSHADINGPTVFTGCDLSGSVILSTHKTSIVDCLADWLVVIPFISDHLPRSGNDESRTPIYITEGFIGRLILIIDPEDFDLTDFLEKSITNTATIHEIHVATVDHGSRYLFSDDSRTNIAQDWLRNRAESSRTGSDS